MCTVLRDLFLFLLGTGRPIAQEQMDYSTLIVEFPRSRINGEPEIGIEYLSRKTDDEIS